MKQHCPHCKRNWVGGRICPYCDCELVAGSYPASGVRVEVRFSVNGKTTTHEMNGPVEMIAQSPTTIGGLFRRLVAPPQAPYKGTSEP